MATSLHEQTPSEPSVSNRGTPSTETLFDDPDADIILRSRDDFDCRVQKVFLVKSSPLLNGLIKAASDAPVGAGETLPVVRLLERGAVLYNLLTFLLPVTPTLPPTLEETMELLSVAQKFEMSHALVHIRGSVALKDPPFMNKDNALHIYSLAQKYGLRREVIQAARVTLKSTLTVEYLQDKLDLMPGDYLYELWGYHQRVRANLAKTINEFRGSGAYAMLKCRDGANPFQKRTWIDDFIVSMTSDPSLSEFHTALARHVCNVTDNGTAKHGCSSCAYLPIHTIDKFWTALTTFVHSNMEKAETAISIPGENMLSQNRSSSYSKSPNNSSATATLPLPECFEDCDADIILQSSDSANFRVHKSILVSSSQVFEDMLSLPQPSSDDTVDGLPVVRLSEDAEIVRALITVLYPIRTEIPSSYERVLALLGAAQKYDMPVIRRTIRAEILFTGLRVQTPAFRAYAIAFSNGLSQETESAARLTLDYPLTFEALGDNLTLFVDSALSELADYRKECRDSVVSCLESFLDVRNGPSKIWVGCPSSKPPIEHSSPGKPSGKQPRGSSAATSSLWSTLHENNERTLPSWLHDLFAQLIEESKQYFTNSLINPSRIREQYLAALRKHSPDKNGCIACMVVHTHCGERYCVELEQKLTSARKKVFDFF